jgi:flagellar M-ring protein FliF
VLSENSENDSLTGLTGTQLTARRNLEQYLAKKAQDMLEKVLGPGQAIVRVSAEINFDTLTRTDEKFDPDGQVIRTQTKNDENNDTTSSGSAIGPAGISSNTTTETNVVAQTSNSPVNNTKNHKTTSTVEYEIGKSVSNLMQAAGGVKRLSCAVTIASHVEGQGADRKVVPRSTEEMEKLRRIVQSAVGIEAGAGSTRGDQLTLEELPFNDQFASDLSRDLDQQQQTQLWWTVARNAAYPVLGLAALVVLIVLFRRTPVQEIPLGVPVGRLVTTKGPGRAGPEWSRETQPGVVTVDVLNRLVKENPANMTQAIRDWMNKGRPSES